MDKQSFFLGDLSRLSLFMVGIKGTGMSSLAALLSHYNVRITGSDRPGSHFAITERVLQGANISYFEGFSPEDLLKSAPDLVIYSSAYTPGEHLQLIAASEAGLPMMSYTQALGAFSRRFKQVITVSGTHGKTTVTGLLGALLQSANAPFSLISGAPIRSLQDAPFVYAREEQLFVAEACEYKANFLSFAPTTLLLTSLDWDHTDYYKTFEQMKQTFAQYILQVQPGGSIIYNASDRNLCEVVEKLKASSQLTQYSIIPVLTPPFADGKVVSKLGAFTLSLPGDFNRLNAALALAAGKIALPNLKEEALLVAAQSAFKEFKGAKGRFEILGEHHGVLFIDDFGHHPREIEKTLKAIKEQYPGRRIVADFVSHTYTRTRDLLPEFSKALALCDVLFLHEIYAAREPQPEGFDDLYFIESLSQRLNSYDLYYVRKLTNSLKIIKNVIKNNDIFLTLGAGNNRMLYNLLNNNGILE